jgi:hypothetical protein
MKSSDSAPSTRSENGVGGFTTISDVRKTAAGF